MAEKKDIWAEAEYVETKQAAPKAPTQKSIWDEAEVVDTGAPQIEERSFLGDISEAYKRGDKQAANDFLGFQAMLGLVPEKQAFQARDDLRTLEQKDPVTSGNMFSKVVQGTARMIPHMAKGSAVGMTTGLGAAGIAGIAGQLGPQAALPEEVITMPAAYAGGYASGSIKYWMAQGAGGLYMDLREQGITPETAKWAATVGSIPYAFIERSQLDKIIPGLGRKGKEFAKKTFMKGLRKLALRYGKNWAENVTQEGLQGAVLQTTEEVTKYIEDKIDKDKDLSDSAKSIAKRAYAEAKESIGPLGLLSAPGAIAGGVSMASEVKRQQSADNFMKEVLNPSETEKQAVQAEAVGQQQQPAEMQQQELESLTDKQLIDLANMTIDEAVNVPDVQQKGMIINRVNNIRGILKARAADQKAVGINMSEAQNFDNKEKLDDIANTGTTDALGAPLAINRLQQEEILTEQLQDQASGVVRETVQEQGADIEKTPLSEVSEDQKQTESLIQEANKFNNEEDFIVSKIEDGYFKEMSRAEQFKEENKLANIYKQSRIQKIYRGDNLKGQPSIKEANQEQISEDVPRGTIEPTVSRTETVQDIEQAANKNAKGLGLGITTQKGKGDTISYVSVKDPATTDNIDVALNPTEKKTVSKKQMIQEVDRKRQQRIETGEYDYYKTKDGNIVFEPTSQELADKFGQKVTEGREIIPALERPTFATLVQKKIELKTPFFKKVADKLGLEFVDTKRGKVEFKDNQTGETLKVDIDADQKAIQSELDNVRKTSDRKVLLSSITRAQKVLNNKRLKPRIKYRNDVKKVLKAYPEVAQVLKKDFDIELMNKEEIKPLVESINKAFDFIKESQRDLPVLNAEVEKTAISKDLKKAEQKTLRREERIKALKGRQKDVVKEQKELSQYVRKNLPLDMRFKADAKIRKLATAMRGATADKYMDHGKRIVDKMSEQRKSKDSVKSIEKLLKKTKPFKKDGVLKGKLDANANKNLNEVRRVIKLDQAEVDKELEAIFKSLEDGKDTRDPTPEEIDQLYVLQMFGNLKEKSSKQIKQAENELKDFINKSRFKNKILDEAQRVERAKLRDEFVNIITGGKGEKTLTQKQQEEIDKSTVQSMRESIRGFDDMNQNFEWMMDKLSRYDKDSKPLESKLNTWAADKVFDATRAAESGNIEQADLINSKLQEIYGKKGRALEKELADNTRILKKGDKTGIFINEKGKKTELLVNQNQAYKLWQLYQDPTTWETFNNMGFSHKTFEQIDAYMKPEVKKWAEWQMEEFYPKYYEGINDVYKKLFNVDLPFNEFYSPISRDYEGQVEDDPFLQAQSHYGSVMNRHLQGRVDSKIPFKLVDGDTTLLSHISEMEHFKAWALPMKDLRSVLGGKNVMKAIREYHGTTATKVINGFLNDFARGGIDRATALNFLDKWRSTYTGAVTRGNPTITIKQLTSIPAYAADMPIKEFNKGLADFMKNPKKAIKTLMDTDFMKARYDKGFERDLILAFRGSQEKGLAKSKGLNDFLSGFIKAGDGAAIVFGGWAAYKYAYDKAISEGKSEADAKQLAEKFFIKTTERSQQAGNIKDLSFFQRAGSLAKLFTMFATSPLSYYRSVYGGLRNLKQGRGSKKANAKRIAIGQFVLPMIFQLAANGMRWETEDELRAALLGPLNKLFIVGDFLEGFVNAVTGADWYKRMFDEKESVPLLSTFADINKIAFKMFNDNEITTEEFLDIAGDILQTASKLPGTPVSGIPITSLRRIAGGAFDAAAGNTSYPLRRVLGFSKYALKEGSLPKTKKKANEIKNNRFKARSKGRFKSRF